MVGWPPYGGCRCAPQDHHAHGTESCYWETRTSRIFDAVDAFDRNRTFRGIVEKLLISPEHRRKAIAKRVMRRSEEIAREVKRTLFVSWFQNGRSSISWFQLLDTETGHMTNPFGEPGILATYCSQNYYPNFGTEGGSFSKNLLSGDNEA